MHQVERPFPLGLQESLTQFKHFEQVLKEGLDIACRKCSYPQALAYRVGGYMRKNKIKKCQK